MERINNITPDKRSAMSEVGLKTTFNIFKAWSLSNDEQKILLGIQDNEVFNHYRQNPESASISNDTLERISYILGIWTALQTLLPDEKNSDNWIKSPNNNAVFNDQTPLKRMLGGQVDDLAFIRQYLESKIHLTS